MRHAASRASADRHRRRQNQPARDAGKCRPGWIAAWLWPDALSVSATIPLRTSRVQVPCAIIPVQGGGNKPGLQHGIGPLASDSAPGGGRQEMACRLFAPAGGLPDPDWLIQVLPEITFPMAAPSGRAALSIFDGRRTPRLLPSGAGRFRLGELQQRAAAVAEHPPDLPRPAESARLAADDLSRLGRAADLRGAACPASSRKEPSHWADEDLIAPASPRAATGLQRAGGLSC